MITMINRYIQNRLVKIIELTKVNNGTTRQFKPLVSSLITSTMICATNVLRQAPSLNESAKVPSLTSVSPCMRNVVSLLSYTRQLPNSQHTNATYVSYDMHWLNFRNLMSLPIIHVYADISV